MQVGMSTQFSYLTHMSDKQELTEQEKEFLDFIAAMLVQVVIKETEARENGANNERIKS